MSVWPLIISASTLCTSILVQTIFVCKSFAANNTCVCILCSVWWCFTIYGMRLWRLHRCRWDYKVCTDAGERGWHRCWWNYEVCTDAGETMRLAQMLVKLWGWHICRWDYEVCQDAVETLRFAPILHLCATLFWCIFLSSHKELLFWYIMPHISHVNSFATDYCFNLCFYLKWIIQNQVRMVPYMTYIETEFLQCYQTIVINVIGCVCQCVPTLCKNVIVHSLTMEDIKFQTFV